MDDLLGPSGEPKSLVPIAGHSYLLKLGRGAILYWVFDEPDEETAYTLFVRLTDKEAHAVHEADYLVGMLEPVRGKLKFPGALLMVQHRGSKKIAVRRFIIPSDDSEYEFVNDLIYAASYASDYNKEVNFGLAADSHNLRDKMTQLETEKWALQAETRELKAKTHRLKERLARLADDQLRATKPEIQLAESLGRLVSVAS
ncbi:hypothetical protein [Mycobacterium sp.]|uniref:hypothetical protein n=1 Tax=Mycobacterium sp. TaxID=1785 RepID=UPI0011FD2BBD|nr:hypothetical protein [Mycobacterium sp.]TAM63539.1 MAG: hypothetical protein EPN51_26585 [Mycobacterium sp.]